jgi:hypothetical protein
MEGHKLVRSHLFPTSTRNEEALSSKVGGTRMAADKDKTRSQKQHTHREDTPIGSDVPPNNESSIGRLRNFARVVRPF